MPSGEDRMAILRLTPCDNEAFSEIDIVVHCLWCPLPRLRPVQADQAMVAGATELSSKMRALNKKFYECEPSTCTLYCRLLAQMF